MLKVSHHASNAQQILRHLTVGGERGTQNDPSAPERNRLVLRGRNLVNGLTPSSRPPRRVYDHLFGRRPTVIHLWRWTVVCTPYPGDRGRGVRWVDGTCGELIQHDRFSIKK
jgi:hypothetical protein